MKTYPCEVDIRYSHNHLINSADALRFRHPSQELRAVFMEYFSNGHTPTSALECHKMSLQTKHGAEYSKVIVDGAKCPTRKWCFDLYYKMFQRDNGVRSSKKRAKCLKNVNRPQVELPVSSDEKHPLSDIEEDEAICSAASMEEPDPRERLKDVFKILENKLSSSPEKFQDPIKQFADTIEKIQNDSSLASALCNFGKYNDAAEAAVRKESKQINSLSRRESSPAGYNQSSGEPLEMFFTEPFNSCARRKAIEELSELTPVLKKETLHGYELLYK